MNRRCGIGGELAGKGGGAGVGSMRVVANLTDLAALTGGVHGELVFVESLQCLWQENAEFTSTPDGITLVQVAGAAPGICWERLTGTTNRHWLSQASWYIDPAAGDDEGDGSLVAPLKTPEEWCRRVSVGELQQSVDLSFLSVFTGDRVIEARLVDGATLTVYGPDATVELTDTVATFTARTHAGANPEASLLTLTGVADFTAHVGRRVRLMSGANAGAFAWILAANPAGAGVGVARTTVWTKADGTEVTPVALDFVEIESLPACGSLLFRVAGSREPNASFRLLTVENLSCASLRFEVSGPVLLLDGIQDGILSGISNGLYNIRSLQRAGCTEQNVYPWSNYTGTGSLGGSFAGAQHVMNLARHTTQGTAVGASLNRGSISFNDVQFFDCSTAAIRIRGPVVAWCPGLVSGRGNGRGLYLQDEQSGGPINFSWATANTPNIKGTTAEVTIVLNNNTANLTWVGLKFDSNQQSGTATLGAGGTVTVTARNANTAGVRISRNTPGGTVGDLSCPQATRTATQFVINSANAADTSTVDWAISGFGPSVYVGPYNTTTPPV